MEKLRKEQRAHGRVWPTRSMCDNRPEDGALVRTGVLTFAHRVEAGLAGYIEASVAFPSSMVDRISPACARAEALTGFSDAAAVESEPFSQWVIEDRFPQDRPAWEAWGALCVDELRVTNG